MLSGHVLHAQTVSFYNYSQTLSEMGMVGLVSYSTLSRKPYLFRRFTGLTIDEFNQLYRAIEYRQKEYEIKRLRRPDRKNVIGQGRKFELELIDRLIMLLIYYKLYITFSLLGFLFGIDQSTVSRNIRHLEPLVKRCIVRSIEDPQKSENDQKGSVTSMNS